MFTPDPTFEDLWPKQPNHVGYHPLPRFGELPVAQLPGRRYIVFRRGEWISFPNYGSTDDRSQAQVHLWTANTASYWQLGGGHLVAFEDSDAALIPVRDRQLGDKEYVIFHQPADLLVKAVEGLRVSFTNDASLAQVFHSGWDLYWQIVRRRYITANPAFLDNAYERRAVPSCQPEMNDKAAQEVKDAHLYSLSSTAGPSYLRDLANAGAVIATELSKVFDLDSGAEHTVEKLYHYGKKDKYTQYAAIRSAYQLGKQDEKRTTEALYKSKNQQIKELQDKVHQQEDVIRDTQTAFLNALGKIPLCAPDKSADASVWVAFTAEALRLRQGEEVSRTRELDALRRTVRILHDKSLEQQLKNCVSAPPVVSDNEAKLLTEKYSLSMIEDIKCVHLIRQLRDYIGQYPQRGYVALRTAYLMGRDTQVKPNSPAGRLLAAMEAGKRLKRDDGSTLEYQNWPTNKTLIWSRPWGLKFDQSLLFASVFEHPEQWTIL
jgi:hypothetical protein